MDNFLMATRPSRVVGKRIGKGPTKSMLCSLSLTAPFSSGVLKELLLSVIRIVQSLAMSYSLSSYMNRKLVTIWKLVLDFPGVMRDWFGLRDAVTDDVLLFSRASFSLCFFFLIFSFHVGWKIMVRLVISLLVFVPFCVALGYFPDAGVVEKSIMLAYGAVFLILLCVYVVSCCLGKREWVTKLFNPFMYPFRRLHLYCCFGCDAVRDYEMSWQVPVFLCFACWWILVTMIFFPYRGLKAFGYLWLFMGLGICLFMRLVKVAMATSRDVRELICSVYYFYTEVTYPSFIYQLCSVGWGSWSLRVYVSLFCIILPLVQKVLFTYKAQRLRSGLSWGDFYKALDESGVTFSSIFTFTDAGCPLWPISESLLRTLYCIFALRKMYLLNL